MFRSKDMIKMINNYIAENEKDVDFSAVDLSTLKNSRSVIDACQDRLLDLYCSIGIDDDYEPNDTGLQLERCIEFLNDIRYKYHDK